MYLDLKFQSITVSLGQGFHAAKSLGQLGIFTICIMSKIVRLVCHQSFLIEGRCSKKAFKNKHSSLLTNANTTLNFVAA